MLPLLLAFLGLIFPGSATLGVQAPSQRVPAGPPAVIQGRVTFMVATAHAAGKNPVRDMAVYLLKFEDSRPFTDLQRRCRSAMGAPKGLAFAAYAICSRSLDEATGLVPSLPWLSKAKTDRDGAYRFEDVPAGQRYRIIGVKLGEGMPVVVVGETPHLSAGQQFTLNLAEEDPWTGPL